jgi:DNA adenine methylase
MSPFLIWAGGKRWFVQQHADLLPKTFNCYIEPFLGGGSVFFHLQPSKSILGDTNPDVIAAYQGIKDNWQALQRSLQYHQRSHSEEHFYKVRSKLPSTVVQRASRMIYLNRTCFNGIYRVNLQGKFNVPLGSKDSVIFENESFEDVSKLLKKADIRLADFEILIDEANSGDFVFADPPYSVSHNLNGFVKYNEKLFTWHDQERLAAALIRARDRGVIIASTNANHPSVRDLYSNKQFSLVTTSRYSSISASSSSRKQFEELIILS